MTCRFGASSWYGQAEAPDTRKSQPTEAVINSTQIRALSVEILLALEEESHCEFSADATETIHTVGAAIHHLTERNRHRTTEVSLANSAKSYWLKPVKVS